MKTKSIGLVLVIAGVLMMIYTGFTFVTREKMVDLGPLEVNKKETHPVQWSPLVGGVLLAGGILLMVTGRNAK